MIDIPEDDERCMCNYLGVEGAHNLPEDVITEYTYMRTFASNQGSVSSVGMWPIFHMMRKLDRPPFTKKVESQVIRWADVVFGLPVYVRSPETGEFVGWFQGDMGHGVLAIRSPFSPTSKEVYAKYVRPATEDDDLSALDEGIPPIAAEAATDDDDEMEYSDSVDAEFDEDEADATPDISDGETELTANDIGRSVLVEDGDEEFSGILTAFHGEIGKVTVRVVVDEEEVDCEYDASDVFIDEEHPIMAMAAAQQAEEEAAEKEAAAKKKPKKPAK